MAIRYPTTTVGLNIEDFRPGDNVESGDTTADHEFGLRGISSEVNFAYGQRTRNLASQGNSIETAINTTTSTTIVNASPQFKVYLGKDIAAITLDAVVTDCGIQLVTSVGNSSETTPVTGTQVDSVTLSSLSSTGGVIDVRVKFKMRAAATLGELFSFTIREDELASGDIP